MVNTMDINVREADKTSSLQFYWLAELKNGSIVMQFENGIENLFQEVKDRFDELKYFVLYNKNYIYNRFTVDLEKGKIYFQDGYLLSSKDSSTQEKKNIRLIYFRRHKIDFGNNLEEQNHSIVYFLGLQYNDLRGNNYKLILQIDSQGNWSLGE